MKMTKEQRDELKAIAEFEPTGDNFSDRVNQQVTNEADLKAVARQAILDLLADLEAEELMSHTLRHHLMSREAELAATRQQLVYEFNGDEVPVFRSGVDTPHELESAVDAERCQGLIGLIRQLRQQLAEAQAKLSEAADDIEGWGAYASQYFQEKHDLAGVVAEYRNADTTALQSAIEQAVAPWRSALAAMCEEFRGHDLPYGSIAYKQANDLLYGRVESGLSAKEAPFNFDMESLEASLASGPASAEDIAELERELHTVEES